ncbi:MAG: wax ester/triacylglycerol synthase family O-acyltransferase [Burkholderiales bacterium]|nr:wax ester/triacylglycerol synthase family O-acyltransferase [Burkholderiales bacterium]
MSRNIPPLDLMWLLVETANAPTHVGALLLFERPARAPASFVADLVASYRAATPRTPFDQVPRLVGTRLPHWQQVEAIDLDYHVQHLVLPAGATERTLVRLVEDLHEPMLDRNRPLFRLVFIEGLPDGRFAMYLKLHHAIIDGMSAISRIVASLATSPKERTRPPMFAVDVAPPRTRHPRRLSAEVSAFNRSALRQTSALKDVSVGLVVKTLRRLVVKDTAGSQPFAAAHLATNEPVRTPRAFAMLALPLETMREIGKAFGGTLNDVAATIVDAGLQRYLDDLGRPARKPLVTMLPVSLRDEGDTSAKTLASAMFVALGAPDAEAEDRMRQVMAAVAAGKADLRAMSKDAALLYATTVLGIGTATEMSSVVGRVTGHLANFVLSNVPGSREDLYLHGARLAAIFPISALALNVGVNVTLTSHAGTMFFGFVGNGIALPDFDRLARHTGDAFAALGAAVQRPAQRRRAKPGTTAAAAAKPSRKRAAAIGRGAPG